MAKVEYKGKIYGSWEEVHFLWICEELKERGFLQDFYHNSDKDLTINISEGNKFPYILESKPLNDGTVNLIAKNKSFVQDLSYVMDFKLVFTEKAKLIFFDKFPIYTGAMFMSNNVIENTCDVEVKPFVIYKGQSVGSHDSLRRFSVIQKVLYDKFGHYINLCYPKQAVESFFCPIRYFYCDKKSSQRRKMSFKANTITQYVEQRSDFLNRIRSKKIKKNGTNYTTDFLENSLK